MSNLSKNIGQTEQVWTDWWKGITPESEIRMWDFYGGRQWISKYVPRFGKIIEAGCGLGRFNFYFSRFGIDIDGIDFSKDTISYLQLWQKKYGLDSNFKVGDVCNLEYGDNSLSGYISLGVVEHFNEGPNRPLREAFRVLRPGGIAIITTPNKSWFIRKRNFIKNLKKLIYKIYGREFPKTPFFQYEFPIKKLAEYVTSAGLFVTISRNYDFMYTILEQSNFNYDKFIEKKGILKLVNILEKSFLSFLAAQSITISVKVQDKMHCFFCGDMTATKDSLKKYSVPVCNVCSNKKVIKYYKKNSVSHFNGSYLLCPNLDINNEYTCDFCSSKYKSDILFEKFGFKKNVCPNCIKNPQINIKLCNSSLQPIWRPRT